MGSKTINVKKNSINMQAVLKIPLQFKKRKRKRRR